MRTVVARAWQALAQARGPRDPRWRGRLGLLAVVLAGVVLVWAFLLHEIRRERETVVHDTAVEAEIQAQVFAEYSRSTIRRIDEYLQDLRSNWTASRATFEQTVRRRQATVNDISLQVGVIDRDGFLAYSNLAPAHERVDLRDREHYRVHAGSPTADRLFISDPVLGKVSGKWSVQFTRPILVDGRFDGVLVISVGPEQFARFSSRLKVAPGGVVAVLKDSGRLIARQPPGTDALGRTLQGSPLMAEPRAESGSFRTRSQTDGVDRLYGYHRLAEYGLIAVVGASFEQALAEHLVRRDGMLRIASVISLLLVAVGFLLWRFGAERRRAQEQARIAALVYQASSEGMIVTTARGHILAVNPAFSALTGYAPHEVIGRTPAMLQSGRHDDAFYADMWTQIARTGHWHGEIWNRRKNGELYPQWLTINTTDGADGGEVRRVGLFTDISEKKKSEELIWHQANFDTLTGLPNRRMFHHRLDMQIRRAQRANASFPLLLLDLDRFKDINDTLGHPAGDALLVEIAARLTACVRDTDTVARLGGDEFTVILAEPCEDEAVQRVVESIQRALARPFDLNGEIVHTTASVGVTFFPRDASDAQTLVKQADQAMFEAKAQGPNRFSYFTVSMQEAMQRRMRLIADLRSALDAGQFHLHYQPIVELATGRIRKAEALLRWTHPVRGAISPAEFIPIAEECGMIGEIGEWVFAQAIEQLAVWRNLPSGPVEVAVNMSPLQLRGADCAVADWPQRLANLGLPRGCLVVEITENSLMEAHAAVTTQLTRLREAGMPLSLDDFGTGYSSLAYLRKFRIDYLKIDQSFVRALHRDSPDTALCEAIIVMAHKLGIKVVAEGVETGYQRDFLHQAGCDFVQGYLISPPVDSGRFERLLRGQTEAGAPADALRT